MKDRRTEAMNVAEELKRTKFSDAKAVFVAGSIIRGEGTRYSDIDLVAVYQDLKSAWRESFTHSGFPVEAFVHDPSTLRYFFEEIDAKSGVPSLPQMVFEGVPLPDTAFSSSLKDLAADILKKGPPALTEADIKNRRYFITDLVDDLREPRSATESTATAVRLYELLADFYLRTNGVWSAKGKTIPRRLHAVQPDLAGRFNEAFYTLFSNGTTSAVIQLASEIIAPSGGFLFDGHRLDAPEAWKK